MQSDDSICHVGISGLHKPNFLHQPFQFLLRVESFDTLHKILIGFPISSYVAAECRNNIERVLLVDFVEDGVGNFAELQAHEPASFFQDSPCL